MPEEKNVYQVLSEIQTELKAPKGQFNKFGGYNYRSLEDILEAVKPILEKHRATLTFKDDVVLIGTRHYVRTEASLHVGLLCTSTIAFAREAETKKGMDEAQITGAASSYARKYAANALFAIDDTKDPDFTNKHGKDEINPQSSDVNYNTFGGSQPVSPPKTQPPPSRGFQRPSAGGAKYVCNQCGQEITEKVANFSFNKHGKRMCMDCQGVPPRKPNNIVSAPPAGTPEQIARGDTHAMLTKIVNTLGRNSKETGELIEDMTARFGTSIIADIDKGQLSEVNDMLRAYMEG